MPSREWCEAEGRWRSGVLVEDGRDGEPTAEEALAFAVDHLHHIVVNLGPADERYGAHIAALAVLRRALESDAR
jgi:hypothetical protein